MIRLKKSLYQFIYFLLFDNAFYQKKRIIHAFNSAINLTSNKDRFECFQFYRIIICFYINMGLRGYISYDQTDKVTISVYFIFFTF